MTHVRAQIRAKAKSLLLGRPTAGQNVYVGRTWPTGDEVLPALLLYTLDEPALDVTMDGRQQRTLVLKVEGRARATDDEVLLALLDSLASDVETALLADATLGGLAKDTMLAGTLTRTGAAAEKRAGELEMSFQIEYHTAAGAPGTAL